MIPATQHEAARLLRELAGADPIETHVSAVFVGADTVWKLKKAVNLGFLDFTTLEGRARMLRRELALNASAAPGLYRDVVAIIEGPGGPALSTAAGEGRVLDYALRMARVPAADFLDHMAAAGRLRPPLLRELADAVADYHDHLAPAGADPVAALGRIIAGNRAAALAAGLAADDVACASEGAQAALEARAAWLTSRRARGFIRRAHGDLHLGNLCLWHGHPVPFDALEFDEAMATIDLGYDLAFLLMDLQLRLGRAAANLVLNRYVARTGDAELVHGLKLFLSLRAMVRAHCLAATGQSGARYLAAAEAFLAPAAPVVIAIGGLQGSGKSSLAAALAPEIGAAPGAVILRSDAIRKRIFAAAPEQPLALSAYETAGNRATNSAMLAELGAAVAGGHSVILDATFLDPAQREAVAAICAGTRFVGIWLSAPLEVLEQRVAARRNDASDADVAVLRAAAARAPGAGSWTAVDATDSGRALRAIRAAVAARMALPA